MMKKLLSVILCLLFILPCFSFVTIAEDVSVISGNTTISCVDADKLSLGENVYTAGADFDFSVSITVSGCERAYSVIMLNDKKIADLVDGENVITLNTSSLAEDENEIKIFLGHGSGTYKETMAYGTYNLDDISVTSVEFSGIGTTVPESVNLYMPIEASAGTTVKSSNYITPITVGDGWFAETNLGGSTPNVPVAVGFVFCNPKSEGIFSVDTTKLADGKYTGVFTSGDKTVEKRDYIIDNTAPAISFSVANGATVSQLDTIEFKIEDATAVDVELKVDGKIANKINIPKLDIGSHTAFVTAVDKAGNPSSKVLLFNVSNDAFSAEIKDNKLTVKTNGEASLYSGELLKEIYMYENRLGSVGQDYLRNSDEVLVSFNDKAKLVTSAIGNSLPYQSFVINTETAEDETAVVSYTGETGNGSDIVLKAWNYKDERWDEIASVQSGKSVSVEVALSQYSKNGKMRVNAYPDIVYNGSDTILWNSDTQYYSRYEALNELYFKINEYAVDNYNEGNIGYCVHTGDLIDQAHMGDAIANSEYKVADKAQDILDSANVPNGVVSGNHDIKHDVADYSYYYRYFGEDRYEDFDWYGGSLNNNMHHYDLVSIGAYDFVFLYIGNYKEIEDDTLAWANAVCQAYPTRNVVICTHEYILPSGAYSGDRAEIFWNEVIVPNENVIMVLCGHNDGVCDQLHQVGDSDRYVLEVLADYQFADLGDGGNGITYVENNCTLDGEGFIRLMTFSEAGQVISNTYSPAADMYNYYPSYSDSFVYDIDMIPASRSICTKKFNVLTNIDSIKTIGKEEIDLSDCEACYVSIVDGDNSYNSKIFVLDEYESNYEIPKVDEYIPEEPERISIGGYENVNENFRFGEVNKRPDSSYVEVGLDLLTCKSLTRTSGSTSYSAKIGDDGSITINHQAGSGGENWITLANYIQGGNIDVSEYDRIYFGVTANESVKWNIYVNFSGKEINFSQNKDIATMFGYVNQTPSDITGTWNGYIDLSDIITGNQTVKSIYLVSATPDATVKFDYLFLGKSTGGKVRFITSDTIVSASEAKIGDKINLPDAPYKFGYSFDGWYTAKEGGEKVENAIVVKEGVTEVFARFSPVNKAKREIKTYNEEVELEQISDNRWYFVIGSLVFLFIAVAVLLIKIISSKKKTDDI